MLVKYQATKRKTVVSSFEIGTSTATQKRQLERKRKFLNKLSSRGEKKFIKKLNKDE